LLCESCEWIEWSGEEWSMRKRDDADQAEWFINSRVNTPDTEIEVAWRATWRHAYSWGGLSLSLGGVPTRSPW
jgi:hypothetical protein